MRKIYTAEQKTELVERYFAGTTITEISKETGVSRSTLMIWIKDYESKNKRTKAVNMRDFFDVKQKSEQQEKVIEILKASPCTVDAPLSERYDAVDQMLEKFNYSVTLTCKALNVDKGSYYNHKLRNKNENTQGAQRRKEITPIIEEIFQESGGTYGADKVHALLKQQGYVIGRNTVAKIMHDNGWFSSRGGAKKLYDLANTRKQIIANQDFAVSRPNQVWAGDVTQFKVGENIFYICVVLDLYSRMVIGCKVSKRNTTHLTKCTFKQAYEYRKPTKGLLFHSDQGANYISRNYMVYLKELGIEQSFSRAHVPYDNSIVESFFKTLKAEKLYLTTYESEMDFRQAVCDYIARYNEDRPHSVLRYRSPAAYEKEYYERQKKKENEQSNTDGSN